VVVDTSNKECFLTKTYKSEKVAYMQKWHLEELRRKGLKADMSGYVTKHGQPCANPYKTNGFRAIRVEEIV